MASNKRVSGKEGNQMREEQLSFSDLRDSSAKSSQWLLIQTDRGFEAVGEIWLCNWCYRIIVEFLGVRLFLIFIKFELVPGQLHWQNEWRHQRIKQQVEHLETPPSPAAFSVLILLQEQ